MKFQRQAKILEIIEKNDIETQEELSAHLRAIGFETTQATVSRDIKELRLIKVLAPGGKYKYATSSKNSTSSFTTRLRNIFKDQDTARARFRRGRRYRRDESGRHCRNACRRRHGLYRDTRQRQGGGLLR